MLTRVIFLFMKSLREVQDCRDSTVSCVASSYQYVILVVTWVWDTMSGAAMLKIKFPDHLKSSSRVILLPIHTGAACWELHQTVWIVCRRLPYQVHQLVKNSWPYQVGSASKRVVHTISARWLIRRRQGQLFNPAGVSTASTTVWKHCLKPHLL